MTTAESDSTLLIKSLLLATIGSVSYLRGFFSESNFRDEQVVDDLRAFPSTNDDPRKSVNVKTIKRGLSVEADRLLDYLVPLSSCSYQENGVFDAIDHQFLKSMILAVYSNFQQPNHVCETYTFDFTYPKDDDPSFSLALSEGPRITIAHAQGQRSLQQMVRRTIYITQNLDPLPDRCWLALKLLYHEKTPPKYSPAGFRDALDDEQFYFGGGNDGKVRS